MDIRWINPVHKSHCFVEKLFPIATPLDGLRTGYIVKGPLQLSLSEKCSFLDNFLKFLEIESFIIDDSRSEVPPMPDQFHTKGFLTTNFFVISTQNWAKVEVLRGRRKFKLAFSLLPFFPDWPECSLTTEKFKRRWITIGIVSIILEDPKSGVWRSLRFSINLLYCSLSIMATAWKTWAANAGYFGKVSADDLFDQRKTLKSFFVPLLRSCLVFKVWYN